ncbi:MAG: hypothetical protein KF700_05160 [Hyphomonadaceae bacterium]|nr:hypothetical protein [Hyphomonadaceae bacterium]
MRLCVLALAALLAACAAQAQTPAPVEHITPPGWERARDDYHYTPAVRAGDFVFVSGVPAGRAPGEESDDPGYDRAFRAIAGLLAAAGADWSDVVEMTTYHTDLPSQFAAFSAVKDRYVSAPYPAWTAIDIDRLLPDGASVEIRVTAYAPRD